MSLGQAWRSRHQAGFCPGEVLLWGKRGRLFFRVQLEDPRPWTSARHSRQLLCQKGDVLELFIAVDEKKDYHEFHVAPNGLILGLHWPEPKSFQGVKNAKDLKPFLAPSGLLHAKVSKGCGDWMITGNLPLGSFREKGHDGRKAEVELHFARYDYLRNGTFVLSSTAPLRRPSFHRRREWNRFRWIEEPQKQKGGGSVPFGKNAVTHRQILCGRTQRRSVGPWQASPNGVTLWS